MLPELRAGGQGPPCGAALLWDHRLQLLRISASLAPITAAATVPCVPRDTIRRILHAGTGPTGSFPRRSTGATGARAGVAQSFHAQQRGGRRGGRLPATAAASRHSGGRCNVLLVSLEKIAAQQQM